MRSSVLRRVRIAPSSIALSEERESCAARARAAFVANGGPSSLARRACSSRPRRVTCSSSQGSSGRRRSEAATEMPCASPRAQARVLVHVELVRARSASRTITRRISRVRLGAAYLGYAPPGSRNRRSQWYGGRIRAGQIEKTTNAKSAKAEYIVDPPEIPRASSTVSAPERSLAASQPIGPATKTKATM
jgi:hypothetical protein